MVECSVSMDGGDDGGDVGGDGGDVAILVWFSAGTGVDGC